MGVIGSLDPALRRPAYPVLARARQGTGLFYYYWFGLLLERGWKTLPITPPLFQKGG